jgi:hypothetical protein
VTSVNVSLLLRFKMPGFSKDAAVLLLGDWGTVAVGRLPGSEEW